ncbi:MAG: CDP-diacylglycerol--glycerol-3-phosphate 3-phosphatidyltransferase [Pseudomonadota bacterium]
MERTRPVRIWNLPNSLTLFRIGCVPLVMLLVSRSDGPLAAFWAAFFFSLASITDLLDGFLARRQRCVTALGKLLDPLADKLLISAALIALIPKGRVSAWVAFLIIGREMAITGLRAIGVTGGVVIDASALGKMKATLQIISLIAILIHFQYVGIDFHDLGTVLLWLALILTVWSGVDYFVRFYRLFTTTEQ